MGLNRVQGDVRQSTELCRAEHIIMSDKVQVGVKQSTE